MSRTPSSGAFRIGNMPHSGTPNRPNVRRSARPGQNFIDDQIFIVDAFHHVLIVLKTTVGPHAPAGEVQRQSVDHRSVRSEIPYRMAVPPFAKPDYQGRITGIRYAPMQVRSQRLSDTVSASRLSNSPISLSKALKPPA